MASTATPQRADRPTGGLPSRRLVALFALAERATTAGVLGRDAHAAELYERAALLAEALCLPDSLAVVHARHGQVIAIRNSSCGMPPGPAKDELRRRAWALLLPLHAPLLRRAAANTLLPGTVRREEVDYQIHAQAAVDKVKRASSNALAAQGDPAGQLVGFVTLCDVMAATLNGLPDSHWPAEECASAQAFVLAAIDFYPRTAGIAQSTSSEAQMLAFVETMHERAYDPDFQDAVLRKWRSAEVSGVLRARGMLQLGTAVYDDSVTEFRARRLDDIAKTGLQECALPSCAKVERTVREFKQYSGCRSVWYCSPEHHTLDWGVHKQDCQRLDKARRAALAAGEEASGAAR